MRSCFKSADFFKDYPYSQNFYSLVEGNDGPNQYEEENKRAVKHFETLPLEELELHSEGCTLRAKLLVPEKATEFL